jgi:nucleotide sugar dehydrogenase
VSSGSVFADLARYPKLVGGIDSGSGVRAVDFYTSVLHFDARPDLPRPNGVWDLGCAEAAELTKLAETTYRDVNIALANEFGRFAEEAGLDIFTVIDAANSQPYSHIHRPGIAVGGHCIPVYPWLYAAADRNARLALVSREVNDAVPGRAVRRLAGLTGGLDGLRVVVLGAAYRGGVRETALSGVFGIVRALADHGAVALVHDPLYSDSELIGLGFAPYRLGAPCDAAIVQADHASYAALRPADLPGVRAIVDGRAITNPARWDGVPRYVLGVGEPGHRGRAGTPTRMRSRSASRVTTAPAPTTVNDPIRRP